MIQQTKMGTYISTPTMSSPNREQKNNITKVEKSRVELIKDAVKNNKYPIKIEETAYKMAKEFLQ